MKKNEKKELQKDFEAVKRALKVFKDKKRLEAVKTVVIKQNKDVTININI